MLTGLSVVAVLLGIVAAAGVVASVLFGWLWLGSRRDAAGLRRKYAGIDDVEAARVVAQAQAHQARAEAEAARAAGQADALRILEAANANRGIARAEARELAEESARQQAIAAEKQKSLTRQLERLTKEIALCEETLDLREAGLYRPIYDFDASEKFKHALDQVWEEQAAMIKGKRAASCSSDWSVGGSKQKGKQMTERNLKLMLRAFNGECDALISKVRFNNAITIVERIQKAYETINQLGEPNHCAVSPKYRDLRVAELRLTYEMAQKLQSEKEEQQRIREQMRDEEQALREIERAQREAERDEGKFEAALAKARGEVEAAGESARQALKDKVAELERRLEEAHEMKERALSRAQLTRSGYVYVISNEGSFGPGVFKVGMTRRLDPMDRVRELGDASVPFAFDVHAIVYAEDAPALENQLHRLLDAHRVNLVNFKKEFFRVSLEQIEAAARQHCGRDVEFVRVAPAEEFRKTSALVRTPHRA